MTDHTMQDHTKQYRRIKGHTVRISFSSEPNPELFSQLRGILLSCSDTSQICPASESDATIAPSDKEGS